MNDTEIETVILRATDIVTSIIRVVSDVRSGKLKADDAHAKLADLEAKRDELHEHIKEKRTEADDELAKKFDHSDDK